MINGIKPLPPKEDFDIAVDNLLKNITLKYNEWMPDSYRECEPTLVNGRKFDKVLHVWSNGSVSVHSFIARKYCNHKSEDLVPGDVMKPAGMNAAAAHSRGNIFAKDYTTFAKWFGVKYLI